MPGTVQVSPQGDRVLFQALGYLWVRDLPDGEPRRLTTQTDHFEHEPAWSRDGRPSPTSGWDDQELATVRVVAAGANEGRWSWTDRGTSGSPSSPPTARPSSTGG
jgi:hypothetical protein